MGWKGKDLVLGLGRQDIDWDLLLGFGQIRVWGLVLGFRAFDGMRIGCQRFGVEEGLKPDFELGFGSSWGCVKFGCRDGIRGLKVEDEGLIERSIASVFGWGLTVGLGLGDSGNNMGLGLVVEGSKDW